MGRFSGSQVPIAEVRADIDAANERMGEQGLRVLAFAARVVAEGEQATMREDPMALTQDLAFVGMVGIIDPLRTEAKGAVADGARGGDRRAHDHGRPCRDGGGHRHVARPRPRGDQRRRAAERSPTRSCWRGCPKLHVFGRVTPEDKLRLARLMQQSGLIVAMTGDAVNDAAALKQADIGVAMGSGSEVTKQAGRMILTDDNFGTLVHAVEIGRRVYDKIVSYVRFQMTQLLALVLLFVVATAFNINSGVALTPSMVLYLLFFLTVAGVVVISHQTRATPTSCTGRPETPRYRSPTARPCCRGCSTATALFVAALIPLVAGPDTPLPNKPSRLAHHDVRRHGARHGVQRARPTGATRRAGSTPPVLKAVLSPSCPS